MSLAPISARGVYGANGLLATASAVALSISATAFLASAGSAAAQPVVPSTFVVSDVRLFDGERVTEHRNVVVSGGQILRVGGVDLLPPDAEVIDGSERTLLPGFIDSHVHLPAAPEQALSQSLALGVTTVIDLFNTREVLLTLKRIEATDSFELADLRTAGIGATAPGGWPTSPTAYPTISGRAEAEAFVEARLSEGSDFIKIFYDDLSRFGPNSVRPTISEDTLRALIEAATAHGAVSVAHVATEAQARSAIGAGAHGLAHVFIGDTVSADFGEFAAAHDAFVIPTLSVLRCRLVPVPRAAIDERLAPFLAPEARTQEASRQRSVAVGRMPCAALQSTLKQLIAASVPILAGSDEPLPGSTYGASLHGELAMLGENGLTPLQALIAATSAPADAFRLVDRGRILPGLRADLLLVEGDPSRDILATRNIVAVWKRGEQATRQRYE